MRCAPGWPPVTGSSSSSGRASPRAPGGSGSSQGLLLLLGAGIAWRVVHQRTDLLRTRILMPPRRGPAPLMITFVLLAAALTVAVVIAGGGAAAAPRAPARPPAVRAALGPWPPLLVCGRRAALRHLEQLELARFGARRRTRRRPWSRAWRVSSSSTRRTSTAGSCSGAPTWCCRDTRSRCAPSRTRRPSSAGARTSEALMGAGRGAGAHG